MSHGRQYAAYWGERLVENPELPVDRRAVVVDPLSSEPISVIECVDRTERVLDAPSRAGEAAPRADMGASDPDFQDDRLLAHVSPLDVDDQVGDGQE
jgi:hypothetical protein